MTESNLRKYINKRRSAPEGTKIYQPVILTDNKGLIEKYAADTTEKQLVWLSKGGAKTKDSARYIKRTISRQIINHGDMWLYVWLGTCDLSSRNKGKYFSANEEEEIDKTVKEYKDIIATVKRFPGSKITFLETPVYSIKKYNTTLGHKDPSVFNDQDEKIKNLVFKLNGRVREINSELGTLSPQFSCDLSASRRVRCGKKRKPKTIKYYNYDLYYDGMHPGQTLGKTWMKKIAEQAKKDCWRVDKRKVEKKQRK